MLTFDEVNVGDIVYCGQLEFSYSLHNATVKNKPCEYLVEKKDSCWIYLKRKEEDASVKPTKTYKKYKKLTISKYSMNHYTDTYFNYRIYKTKQEAIEDWNSLLYNEIDRLTSNYLSHKLYLDNFKPKQL